MVSVDFSQPLIDFLLAKYVDKPSLRFIVADCRSLELLPNAYDAVVDKGTLDALLCAADSATGAASMLNAVAKTLSPGGHYVVISYAPPTERALFARFFPDEHWETTVWMLPKPGHGQHESPRRWCPSVSADGRFHFVYLIKKMDGAKEAA